MAVIELILSYKGHSIAYSVMGIERLKCESQRKIKEFRWLLSMLICRTVNTFPVLFRTPSQPRDPFFSDKPYIERRPPISLQFIC